MEQPHTTSTELSSEAPIRPPEEVIHDLVQGLESLLESGEQMEAMEVFAVLHPVDQGEVLEGLPKEFSQQVLEHLDAAAVAEILEYLEPEESAEMIGGREPAELAQVLDLTGQDVAVDLLHQIPEDKQSETLEAMVDSDDVEELLKYKDDTAGGLMTREYPVVNERITTPNALDQLRLLGEDAEDINSVFVVDDDQRLVGSLSITRLALARFSAVVGDVMDPGVNSVTVETDQEQCARVIQRYNLDVLPVLDGDHRLAGVIRGDDLVDVVVEEATEDMLRLASVGGGRIVGPITNSIRSRLPWLYINLGTAFVAAVMVSLFEATITRVVALAIFCRWSPARVESAAPKL